MNVAIEGLVFRRGRRTVLAIPQLEFAAGRVVGLLGPNGSGKSTLLRLISGLEHAAEGVIRFDGAELGRSERSRAIAHAFQEPVFVSGTLRENFDLALRLRKLPERERSARIEEAAAACGISALLDRNAAQLSGGEAQRANLARALSLRAPLTLLDEPLTGLDAAGRKQLLHALPALLRQFTRTAIVVTHDREEAVRLADDLAVLVGGQVRASGPKAYVLRHPPDPETAEILGFTVVESEGGLIGIAPGALRAGEGAVPFLLQVENATELGSRAEVSGWIGSAPVTLSLAGPAPAPGTAIAVSADARDVVRFR